MDLQLESLVGRLDGATATQRVSGRIGPVSPTRRSRSSGETDVDVGLMVGGGSIPHEQLLAWDPPASN